MTCPYVCRRKLYEIESQRPKEEGGGSALVDETEQIFAEKGIVISCFFASFRGRSSLFIVSKDYVYEISDIRMKATPIAQFHDEYKDDQVVIISVTQEGHQVDHLG
jgi:hypothetical protein